MNNKNLDLISIIIPCFNSGKTIKRTISSIDNQTWDNKEIIVNDEWVFERKIDDQNPNWTLIETKSY